MSTKADPETVEDVYRCHGLAFDSQRAKNLVVEGPWLDRFATYLPKGAAVLDLGCGAGEPIAQWLVQHGYAVTGVDFAPESLALAQKRIPDADWVYQDMRKLELGRTFDGIVGWDSFFHLSRVAQRRCMKRLARHLGPGGVLMLTVGPEDGEVSGRVNGAAVYHASLSPDAYREELGKLGLSIVEFAISDVASDQRSILLAQKT